MREEKKANRVILIMTLKCDVHVSFSHCNSLSSHPATLTFIYYIQSENGAVIPALLFGVFAKADVDACILKCYIPKQDGDVIFFTGADILHPLTVNVHFIWLHMIRWNYRISQLIGKQMSVINVKLSICKVQLTLAQDMRFVFETV